MIPSGSSASLIRRITASSAPPRQSGIMYGFSFPIPCSAEKLPSSVAHHLVHRIHDGVILRQEPRGIGVHRLFQIEVDVAVAHVAERHGADAGHQGLARSMWHGG